MSSPNREGHPKKDSLGGGGCEGHGETEAGSRREGRRHSMLIRDTGHPPPGIASVRCPARRPGLPHVLRSQSKRKLGVCGVALKEKLASASVF